MYKIVIQKENNFNCIREKTFGFSCLLFILKGSLISQKAQNKILFFLDPVEVECISQSLLIDHGQWLNHGQWLSTDTDTRLTDYTNKTCTHLFSLVTVFDFPSFKSSTVCISPKQSWEI